MIRPDDKLLMALSRLEHNGDFIIFKIWLEKSLDFLREQSDIIDNINDIKINQGKRRALIEILEKINKARQWLEDIKQQEEREHRDERLS